MPTINSALPYQTAMLARAAAVTDELVEYAVSIHNRNFRDNPNPQILPAIITALASAYVAETDRSKNS